MVHLTLPNGTPVRVPALPLEVNGSRLGARLDFPKAGEHSAEIAREIGYADDEVARLKESGVISIDA